MAIAFDAASGTNVFGNSGSAKTVSLTIGGGSNRVVVALVSMRFAQSVSAITFNGVAMSLAKVQDDTTTFKTYIYYLLEANLPSAGTYTLSVTPSAATWGGIACLSLSGVKQSAPEATDGGFSSTAVASWSNQIATLSAGAWVIDAVACNDRTFTPNGSQVERFDFMDATTAGQYMSTLITTTAGTYNMGETPSTSTAYAQAIVAFAPFVETSNFFLFF